MECGNANVILSNVWALNADATTTTTTTTNTNTNNNNWKQLKIL